MNTFSILGRILAAMLSALPLGAQAAPASCLVPGRDLNAHSTLLMAPAARVQQFYEAKELDGSSLSFRSIALRYDGLSSAQTSAPFTIDNLEILLGTTAMSVEELGAEFDSNLTSPLQTVFTAQSRTFQPDLVPTRGAGRWGGIASELVFDLDAPMSVQIPAGGCIAIEMRITGNSNAQIGAVAFLDMERDLEASEPGEARSEGVGCWQTPLTINTSGSYEPGTAFTIDGHNFPPYAPTFVLVTADLLSHSVVLPGTPNCWFYVEPESGFVLPPQMATPAGLLAADGLDGIPLPPAPSLRGSLLYVQAVSPIQPTATNPAGVVTSNYRTIRIGSRRLSSVRGFHAANGTSATAEVASEAVAGGLAMQLR